MTTRVLPVEEWDKLEGTELAQARQHLPAAYTVIWVVEDDDGRVIGCWAEFTATHVEGLWIHPDYRAKSSVARRLWLWLCAYGRSQNLTAVITGALSPAVTTLLARHGAQPLPAQYVLPLPTEPHHVTQDRALGRAFHAQLARFPAATPHDDDGHNVAVGRALRIGVQEQDPARALADYNAWALRSGSDPVQSLTYDGAEAVLTFAGVEMRLDSHLQIQAVEVLACHS